MNIVNGLRGVKKVVASFSIAALVATSFAIGVAQAQTFPDVNPSDWYYSFVEDLVAQGVVNGSMPAYRPADKVNRAEMAKLVVEAFDIDLINPTKQTFKDVETDKWYYPYIETAVAHGIVGGYKDEAGDYTGYYGPGDDVTREQAAKMIVLGAPLDINTGCGPTFDDVKLSSWSYEFVETLYVNSIVDGYDDGTFGPNKNIVRSEVAKIVSNAMDPILRPCGGFSVESATAMSDTTVEVCYTMNYDDVSALMVENYEVKDVDGNKLAVKEVEETSDSKCVVLTTEAQEASKVYNLVVTDVVSDTDMDLLNGKATFKGYTVGKVGDLTVRLDGSTPEGTNIPRNAGNVLYTVLNFSAGSDEAVRIEELTIARKGLGLPDDFEAVKLYVNGVQKGSNKTVNKSTNSATFSMKNKPIVVNAGTNLLVEVRGDMEAEPNSINALCLNASADVVAYGQNTDQKVPVSGSFAICGKEMRTTSAEVGEVTYTVKDYDGDLEVGDTEEKVVSVTLDVTNKEDVEIRRVTFTQEGSAMQDNFSNPVLYFAGNELKAKAVWAENDTLTFDLSEEPLLIERGGKRTLDLYVDIAGGIGKTVLFNIDESSHLDIIGKVYDYGVKIKEQSTPPTLTARNIVGGDLAIAHNKSYDPSESEVAPGSEDFVFFVFNVSAGGEGVEIEELTLIQTGSLANDEVLNSVRITDKNLKSTSDVLDYDGSNDLEFKGFNFELKQGETMELFVVGNLSDNAATIAGGDTIEFELAPANIKAKYTSGKNEKVTDITGGILTSKYYEIADPSIDVNLKTVPGNKNVVAGSKGVEIARWDLKSHGTDVKVSNIDFTCDHVGGTNTCKDVFSNVSLYLVEGSTETLLKGGVKVNTGDPAKVVFSSIKNLVVPVNTISTISLRADVLTTAVAGQSAEWNIVNNDDVKASAPNINNNDVDAIVDVSAREVTFAAGGAMTTTISASTPNSNAILAGSKNNKVTSILFEADNSEDIKVTRILLEEGSGNVATIDRVKLYDGDKLLKETSLDVAGYAEFKNLDIIVPKDGDKVIDVVVDTNKLEGSTVTSGMNFYIDIDEVDYKGESSGTVNTDSGLFSGNTGEFLIYNSLPVLTRTSASVGGGGLDNDMLEFTFAVEGDSGKKGMIEEMKVTFDGYCNAKPTAFKLYEGSKLIGEDTDSDLVIGSSEFTNSQGVEVKAGESKKLTIKASTVGCLVDETLVVTVVGFTYNDGKLSHPATVGDSYLNFDSNPFPLSGPQFRQ